MANDLTLSVKLTGDGSQLTGTLKGAQGDVREFSATTERESKKAETALVAPGRSAVTVSDHLRTTQREARIFGTEATQGGREATQALSQTSQQVQTTRSHFNLLRTTVGLALGAFSVRQVAGMVDGWSDMRSVVGAAIGDMDAAGDMMRRITDIANASYAPLEQTARTYASNVSALRDLGRSAEETADYTESLNHHLVLTATRGQEAESVQNALSRAMAVGRLQADGLETVLANGGEVAQSLANELGVTVSQLRGLASEGRITGDVIASALIGSLEDVRDRAGEMPATIEDGFVRIGTSATRLVGEMDQALGVSGGVADIMIRAADAIGNSIDPLIANISVLQSGITIVGAAAGAYVTYRSVLIGVTAAQWAFNAAVRANPLGIFITLVGAAAGALYTFREEARLTGTEAYQTTLDVDGLAHSFRLLTEAQQENKRASLLADLTEMRLEAGRLGNELVEVSRKVRDSGQLTPEGGALPIATPEDIARGRELRGELNQLLANIEGGTELLGQYDKAMEEVGQTSQQTQTRTRDLAEANASAAKTAREAARETTTLANSYENLLDRLNPNRRAARQYAQDLGVLNLAFATGRMSAVQYMQAMGLLHESFQEAQRDSEELATTVGAEADRMATLWTRQLERMDDASVDMWRSFLDGSEDAFGSFRRLALDTLAEVIHAYTTRQITASFGVNASGGGMPGAAPGGGFGISPGSIGNAWNAVQNGFGNIQWGGAGGAQAYGGSGWLSAANTQTGLWGGSMQNFSGMQGLAGAGAGFAGSYAGTQIGESLFGKKAGSSYGATGGALVGTYFGGPLGAAIGGAIGGALDAAFGSGKSNPRLNVSTYGERSAFSHDSVATSSLGTIGFGKGTRRSDELFGGIEEERQWLAAYAALDDMMATLAETPAQLDEMKRAAQGFHVSVGSAAEASARMNDRTVTIAATLDGYFAASLRKAGLDAEQMTARVVTASQGMHLMQAASERLNLQYDKNGHVAMYFADMMVQQAGGLENLSNMQSAYFQNYHSEAERTAHLQGELTQALNAMGMAMPENEAGFRALVEAQNQHTEAGARNYVQLLSLSGAFYELQQAMGKADQTARSAADIQREKEQLEREYLNLKGDTAAIRMLEWNALDESNRALQDRNWLLQDEQERMRTQEQLEKRYLNTLGTREAELELRERELNTMDAGNQERLRAIHALEDEQAAQKKAEQAHQQRIQQIERESKAWAQARDQLASFGVSIDNWLDNLRGTDAGLGSPADQLTATSQAFYEQYDKAKSGDRDALNSITQYADRFIEAQKGWSASGTQTTATIDKVAGMMAALPEQLSPEQFLADEFRDALDGQTTALQAALDLNGDGTISAIERSISADWDTNDLLKSVLHQEMRRLGTTVLTEAQIRTALRPHATDAEIDRLIRRVDVNGDGFVSQQELTNARLSGLTSGFASAIASEFDRIDIDASGLIDYNEFRRAFSGMATDAELRRIFNTLDRDGSGTISRLDAINSTTGRVSSNTGSIDSRARNSQTGMRVTLTHGQPGDVLRQIGWVFGQQMNVWSNDIGKKHAQQMRYQGIGNSGKAYAHGGVFTNTIVDTPTFFNESVMGEAGPEAIMPLHMGPDGLGIKNYNDAPAAISLPPLPSLPLLNNSDIVEAVRDLKREVTQLRKENAQLQREGNKHAAASVRVSAEGHKRQIEATERGNRSLGDMAASSRLERAR